MITGEDPVAPWDTPEFKAKRDDPGSLPEVKAAQKRLNKIKADVAEERKKRMKAEAKQDLIERVEIAQREARLEREAKKLAAAKFKGKSPDAVIMDEIFDWEVMEPSYETHQMDGVNVLTHIRARCQGRNCVIHNPSDHHMRDWPKRFHQPSQQTSRVCEHGFGHPDPDDVAYWREIEKRRISTSHDCDGCCTAPKQV